MQTLTRRKTIVGYASAVLILVAVFTRPLPGREWLGVAGFTALAAVLLSERHSPRRSSRVLFALYLLIIGAHFGGKTVWGQQFAWLDDGLLVAMCVVVPLMLWDLGSRSAATK